MDSHAEWDATEASPQAHGNISKALVLLQATNMAITTGADPTHSQFVTTTPPESMNLAETANPHQNVSKNATPNQEEPTAKTKSTV